MPWWIYPFLLLGDFALWFVHEAGHMIAWKAMGINPKGIGWKTWKRIPVGLGIAYKADVSELKASHKLLGALSGPLASILAGIALWQIEPLIGACSILFGLLCCFPIRDSDGWKIGKYSYQLTKQGVSCLIRKITAKFQVGIQRRQSELSLSTIAFLAQMSTSIWTKMMLSMRPKSSVNKTTS